MNILKKSIAVFFAAVCVTNLSAKNKNFDAENKISELAESSIVKMPRKTHTRRVLHEISRTQRKTRKAMKRYLSAASGYGINHARTKRAQHAVDETATDYCELLRDISERVEEGSMSLPSFKSIHGIELVALKGMAPSKLWPTLGGAGLGFLGGAGLGAAFKYFFVPTLVPFNITALPVYATYALTAGVAGAVLGGICGLVGACIGRASVDEESLEQAEEYLEAVTEKITAAENAITAYL